MRYSSRAKPCLPVQKMNPSVASSTLRCDDAMGTCSSVPFKEIYRSWVGCEVWFMSFNSREPCSLCMVGRSCAEAASRSKIADAGLYNHFEPIRVLGSAWVQERPLLGAASGSSAPCGEPVSRDRRCSDMRTARMTVAAVKLLRKDRTSE